MRQIFETKSGTIALSGVLAACSLATMMCACFLPVSRTGMVAISGLFPLAGALKAGWSAGYLCWGSAGILGLLLLPDKGIALVYLLFLGLYPVLKGQIESIRKILVEWILKLLYFNFILLLARVVFQSLILNVGFQWTEQTFWWIILAANALFVCYDFLLSRVVALLRRRLK